MNVRELIAALQKMPPTMEVTIWDHEADENLPVVEVLHEWGHTSVELLAHPSGSRPMTPEEIEESRDG